MPVIDAGLVVVAASTVRSVGLVIAVAVALAVGLYAFVNFRQGKPEIGSEIELAPNRKRYYDDEELEGKVLTRWLGWALGTLVLIAVGLPLYWLGEPARNDGWERRFNRQFVDRGGELFASPEESAQGLGCAGCHGADAGGGVAPFTLTDANGDFVDTVNWRAPALNSIFLRYSPEEIADVITFGRPFSPMPAWGVEGGGPLNEQQVQNLVDYIGSIQITAEEAQEAATAELANALDATDDNGDPLYASEGEALFNLGLDSGFAGGSYSCARCHTAGASYGQPGLAAGGALGPNLTNEREQFPGGAAGFDNHLAFVEQGSDAGAVYGEQGQGSGQMPSFVEMFTPEQLRAIVDYERNLAP